MPRRRITRAESQAQTRERLLAGAARVFARRGYHGASIAEIAEEAGYTHGAVYSNFSDKEELFLTLYEDWVAARVAEIEAEHAQATSVAQAVASGVENWLKRLADDPDAFLLRLEFTARSVRDTRLRRKLSTRVGAVPLALQRLIERDAKAEGLSFVVPVEQVAMALQSLSVGLALESLANPGSISPGLGGELAVNLIDALSAPARPTARRGSRAARGSPR